MTNMTYEVYDALRNIGVEDDKAREAATVLRAIEIDLKQAFNELKISVDAKFKLVFWMFSLLVALQVGLFWMMIRMLDSV